MVLPDRLAHLDNGGSMNVTITTRHCTISEPLRQHAVEGTQRLVRFNPKITSAEITFEEDGGRMAVEAVLKVSGSAPLVATGTAHSLREALDQMLERLARRARRGRERRLDKRTGREEPPAGPAESAT
jgi:ribosomal subunit interface protein